MGKRKKSSRKPNGPKKNDPLPTAFTCLFCNHEKAVAVKLDKKVGIGYLECKVCGQKFQCDINYLSAPVDVYGEWVDAADSVAKVEGDSRHERLSSGRLAAKPSRGDAYDDDDGDNRHYNGDGIVGDDEYD